MTRFCKDFQVAVSDLTSRRDGQICINYNFSRRLKDSNDRSANIYIEFSIDCLKCRMVEIFVAQIQRDIFESEKTLTNATVIPLFRY